MAATTPRPIASSFCRTAPAGRLPDQAPDFKSASPIMVPTGMVRAATMTCVVDGLTSALMREENSL